MIWYPHYPGDYGRDTAHLSLTQDGAYRRLLDHYYSTERAIPTHVEQVFRICRAFDPEEQAAVRSVLARFFVEGSDGWHNPRADREIAKSRDLIEKRSRAGKASASKRGGGSATDEPTHVEQVLTQSQPQSQSQIPSQSKTDLPHLGNNFVHSKEKSFSQTDFDERDSRELAKAKRIILSRVRAIEGHGWVSEDEFMTAVCEESGLLPDRVRELEQKSKWAAASA